MHIEGFPGNSNGKESAGSVASYYQDSLCKLYSPKELDVVLGPFRVLFSISTQKTRGKLEKKKKSLCNPCRQSRGPEPTFWDCYHLAGLGVGSKATLMMS